MRGNTSMATSAIHTHLCTFLVHVKFSRSFLCQIYGFFWSGQCLISLYFTVPSLVVWYFLGCKFYSHTWPRDSIKDASNHLDTLPYVREIHLVRSQNFPKTYTPYPLIRTRTCAYQGVRNISFSENFANVPNAWSLKVVLTWR